MDDFAVERAVNFLIGNEPLLDSLLNHYPAQEEFRSLMAEIKGVSFPEPSVNDLALEGEFEMRGAAEDTVREDQEAFLNTDQPVKFTAYEIALAKELEGTESMAIELGGSDVISAPKRSKKAPKIYDAE